jgi:stearoyl-CoA desaturase (Delta-9 desaturase)
MGVRNPDITRLENPPAGDDAGKQVAGSARQTRRQTPAGSAETPGVGVANPAARRMQRNIALAVVIIPFLGFIAAIAQLWLYGIGRLELGMLAGTYALSTLGITVGFHRYFAHRAFQTNTAMRVMLAILGSMAAQGPVLFWVATHRRHHAYSDRPGDPHSPQLHGKGVLGLLRGLWHAHIGWFFSGELTSWAHYAPDLLRDRVLFRINQQYFIWVFAGLMLPAALGGLLSQTWVGVFSGFLWGGLVRMFIVNQVFWAVGSICHLVGSRPFETRDWSANNFWIALISFGEGLQNNHHAFPSSATHGLEWWQPDLSAWVIHTLARLGLIWDVKVPTARMIMEAKKSG